MQTVISAAGTALAVLAARLVWGREAALAALLCSIFWCVFYFIWASRRYREIRTLAGQIDELLHGSEVPEFKHFREGDLEILRDEINKLTIRRCYRRTNLLWQTRLQTFPIRYGRRLRLLTFCWSV